MAWIVFWLVVGACGLAATFAGYRARQGIEETIRQGIDKGVIADPDAIIRARAKGGVPWPLALIALGVINLFAGLGIGAFGYFIGVDEPESLLPLLGIAAFVGLLGSGLLISGIWLSRALSKRD